MARTPAAAVAAMAAAAAIQLSAAVDGQVAELAAHTRERVHSHKQDKHSEEIAVKAADCSAVQLTTTSISKPFDMRK